MATRSTLDEPFGQPVPIVELNSPGREPSIWVSEDGRVIYFLSNRSGKPSIYRARR